MLINTGAGISIFKPHRFDSPPQTICENIAVTGITNDPILIVESTLIAFNHNDPHKIYTYDVEIEFYGQLGFHFLNITRV